MEEGSILRIDRLLSFALVSGGAALLALFEGGTSAYFALVVAIALAGAALISEIGFISDKRMKLAALPSLACPILLLTTISVLSFLWSADKGSTLSAIPLLLLGICAFWAVSRMVPKGRQATVFTVFFVSSAALAFSIFSWAFSGEEGPAAPSFPFLNAEGFSVYALAIAAFSIGMLMDIFLEGRGRSEEAGKTVQAALGVISGLIALLSVAAVLLSRSAFTAVLLLIVALLVPTAAKPGKRAKALAISVACLVAGVIAAFVISFMKSGAATWAFEGFIGRVSDELYIRAQHWIMALKLGARNPFGGFGAGTFKDAMPLVYSPGAFPAVGDAHSLLLGAFAEIGLAGALLFVIFAATVVLATLKDSNEGEAPLLALFAPVAALTIAMFTGSLPPAVLVIYFILAGQASAGSVPADAKSTARWKYLPSVPILLIGLLTMALSFWGLTAIPVKDEAIHHAGHAGTEEGDETFEEGLEGLVSAYRLNPYDKELLFEITNLKVKIAGAANPRDYSAALKSADELIEKYPYYSEAHSMRGGINMADGGEWQADFEKAASLSAGDIVPHLVLINYGLKDELDLAVSYADKALEEEEQLFYRAGMPDIEGVLTLANLAQLEAKSYVAYKMAGEEAKAAARTEKLARLYGMNEAVEGHVHGILESYGMEDPVHGL